MQFLPVTLNHTRIYRNIYIYYLYNERKRNLDVDAVTYGGLSVGGHPCRRRGADRAAQPLGRAFRTHESPVLCNSTSAIDKRPGRVHHLSVNPADHRKSSKKMHACFCFHFYTHPPLSPKLSLFCFNTIWHFQKYTMGNVCSSFRNSY